MNQSELTTGTPPPPGVRRAVSTARPATMAAYVTPVTTGRSLNPRLSLSLGQRESNESQSSLSGFSSQERYRGLPRYRGAQFPWQQSTHRPSALGSQQPPPDRQPLAAQQPARCIWGATYPHHTWNHGEWRPSSWERRDERLRRGIFVSMETGTQQTHSSLSVWFLFGGWGMYHLVLCWCSLVLCEQWPWPIEVSL